MNAEPLVSIIIPVYNTEQYLAECLDSVCGQTVREIEIICVNDGSRDSSLEILQAYAQKDERIRVIDQPNSGVSVARNRGIDEAKGKYICFVDSDDKVELDLCEQTLTVAEKIDADLVYYPTFAWKSPKIQNLEKYSFIDASIEERALGMSTMLGGPCEYLINRKFLLDSNLRFPVGIRVEEDICFCYQMWPLVKNFAIVPYRLYWYRNNATSAIGSITRNKDKLFDIFQVYAVANQCYLSIDCVELRLIFIKRILSSLGHSYQIFDKHHRKEWKKRMDEICDDVMKRFISSNNTLPTKYKYFFRRMYGTKSQVIVAYLMIPFVKMTELKIYLRRWVKRAYLYFFQNSSKKIWRNG